MWESESEGHGIGSYKHERQDSSSVKNDGFERRGHSWHVTSEIASDLLVKVGDSTFHLHKYPLLARSGKMNRLIYETTSSSVEMGQTIIELDDLPGGPESFELAAKFCYGVSVDLTATNISGLRCTAEYLEMTEDLEEGNLIFKTEAFLSYVVLSSWRDSIVVLKSCENLSPWAENLQIVRRCSESIAWKACANPRSIRWAYTGRINSPKWNNAGSKESSPNRNNTVPPDWWFEDVSLLRIDHFVRVVTAIKVKGMHFELIAAAIVHYATKWLPGLGKESNPQVDNEDWNQGLHLIVSSTINKDDMTSSQVKNQRLIIESLISIIPPQKDCVSCSFLLRLLKLANMLKVAPALVTELEKRVGMQLEQASLADLLIPSYNTSETLYDVDLVQRLVEHFLVQENTETSSPGRETYEKHGYDSNMRGGNTSAKMRVARILDSYLTEVSRDRNLSLTKFQVLAEAFPEPARICDDGLYRAIDSYLKAHPTLTEHERKRLCRVMDCQKLSIDACMHAAQNERLPLRVVVQVLFSEQVKISNALANSSVKDSENPYNHYQPMVPTRKQLLEGTPQSFQEGWATAKKDINTLKFELENMKAKYSELQHEMENLQRQFETMTPNMNKSGNSNKVVGGTSAWSSGWKKLGKLTKTGGGENIGMGGQVTAGPAPGSGEGHEPKKAPRRWRYSVS